MKPYLQRRTWVAWQLCGYLDGLIGSVAPHVEQMMRHGGVADPAKLLPVELDLLPSDELIEVERGLD